MQLLEAKKKREEDKEEEEEEDRGKLRKRRMLNEPSYLVTIQLNSTVPPLRFVFGKFQL